MTKQTKPTDDDILDYLREHPHGEMTYVVRNVLARRFKGLKTDWVRRRLAHLEKAGRVRRVPSNYAVQICWAVNR